MMKKNHYKRTILQFIFIATIFLIASCEIKDNPDGSKDIAEDRNEEKFANNKLEKDAEFLVKAAEINLKEIQLGHLAQQNGRTLHLKELGKMMEDAHSKSQQNLIKLAESKNISIPNTPTDDSNEIYTMLNEELGDNFDNAYTDKMVIGHKEAIKTFEQAAKNSKDQDIKNWAKTTIPELRKHLDYSIKYQKKYVELN